MKIILASQSPRRKEILSQSGLEFSVMPSDAEETAIGDPVTQAEEVAIKKACAIAATLPDALVIGADTAVWLDGEKMGKPKDREEAIQMLTKLNGRIHEVITGVAVIAGGHILQDSEISRVRLESWSAEEIEDYVDRCKPFDKAGAYGIQEIDGDKISLNGNYDNVVGLPLALTLKLIKAVEEKNEQL